MSGNPLIDQGTLNRLLASVSFPNFTTLNVTPEFMNREMIRLALEGEFSKRLPTGTGQVPSPEPYVPATLTINLLKSQPLSAAFKAQWEQNVLLGDCTVRGDSAVHPPYDLTNCSIQSVRELSFSGDDAGCVVVIGGTYNINSALWG